MRIHSSLRALRSAATLAAALVLVACGTTASHSGNAPEGARRPLPRDPAGIGSGSHATGPDGGHDVDSEVLYGVLTSKVFHRKGCKLLEDVSERDRIVFLSAFDGYDAGFFPCDECRSGPR